MNKSALTAVIIFAVGAATSAPVLAQIATSSGQNAGGPQMRRAGEPSPAHALRPDSRTARSGRATVPNGQRGVSSGQRAGGPSACRPGEVNCRR